MKRHRNWLRMILKDTKIYWRSYTLSVYSETLFDELSLFGFPLQEKSESEFACVQSAAESNNAVVWVLVFDSPSQLQRIDARNYHALHESFVYLFVDGSQMYSDHSHTTLAVKSGVEKIAQALLNEEQVIVQRCPLKNHNNSNEIFNQLNFYGHSSAFLKTIHLIEYFANSDECVFVKGETGTGKEITARSMHYLSSRKAAPFIPINCGAFTDDLFLSEVFGHAKGAFTGATKSKAGLLELADKGTVFLDEVDALSLKAQVALLRFLQDSEIRPVGSNTIKTVDVRIFAASNRDIKLLISQGKFREDLFYRLDVLSIKLPGLRHREEDIALLGQYFLAKCALSNNFETKVFSQKTVQLMRQHLWPGNIRELENFVKRAYLMTEGKVIHYSVIGDDEEASILADEHLTNESKQFHSSFNEEKQTLICEFEKEYLHQILSRTKGNISRAATIAKKERRSFCRLMKKHGLERTHYLAH